MTPIQCKMARAALGWGVRDLAEEADVAVSTVSRFEAEQNINLSTMTAMKEALENGGFQFIPENGGGPGVRLKP
ncbi:MAG: helix-turn-helix transcriptional regulator [Pseudomonadota bacterium]